MTQITLDRELIPLKSPRINLTMELKEADMSGQTSATDRAEQGIKGKVLAVSGIIPFKEAASLNKLMQMAQQTENGKRKIYLIGNELAKAMKIRQVRFTGRVQSDEQESLMAWKVSFTLCEYLSVPEAKDQQNAAKNPEGKTAGTDSAAKVEPKAHAAAVTDTQREQPELSGFAKTLRAIEEWLS